MKLRLAAPLVPLTLLLASTVPSPVRAATVPGDEWEVTTKMSMEGMPMQMPARTQKICRAKDRAWDEPPMDKQSQERCKVSDWNVSGNHATWKVTCEGGMSGTGDMTFTPDSYTGTMKVTMDQGSMKMDMTGKRTGKDCDAEEMKRTVEHAKKQADDAQKAQADAMAAMCRDAAATGNYRMLLGPTALPQCKDPQYKPPFCAFTKGYKGYDNLLAANDPKVMSDVMSYCGTSGDAILKDLCSRATAEKEYRFLAGRCPAEAKALAQKECSGRQFTGAPPSSVQGFCVMYAEKLLK